MGYTTDFKGRFDCWRGEGPIQAEFLKSYRAGDGLARMALDDWLTEQGDPRGERIAALPTDHQEGFWMQFGLRAEHAAYLRLFSNTRRMKRDASVAAALPDPCRVAAGLPIGAEGGYFVGGGGHAGQGSDGSILEYNHPPAGQPGLWCQWEPNAGGTAIEWNGAEKFYEYVKWLEYLLLHFLTPWGYTVEGDVDWEGEDTSDQGTIRVRENKVEAIVRSRRQR